jgi:hypothetical protein
METLFSQPTTFTSKDDLEQLSELLHDETFDLDALRFDNEARLVSLPVRRLFHSGPMHRIKRGWFSKTYEKDWMHSLVKIRNVKSWEVLGDQGINTYTFDTWSYRDALIELVCSQRLILRFQVQGLDIEVSDIGFRGRGRIKTFLFLIESSSTAVYE